MNENRLDLGMWLELGCLHLAAVLCNQRERRSHEVNASGISITPPGNKLQRTRASSQLGLRG